MYLIELSHVRTYCIPVVGTCPPSKSTIPNNLPLMWAVLRVSVLVRTAQDVGGRGRSMIISGTAAGPVVGTPSLLQYVTVYDPRLFATGGHKTATDGVA